VRQMILDEFIFTKSKTQTFHRQGIPMKADEERCCQDPLCKSLASVFVRVICGLMIKNSHVAVSCNY